MRSSGSQFDGRESVNYPPTAELCPNVQLSRNFVSPFSSLKTSF